MPYTKKLNEFKDSCDLTNQEISEKSGVPLGTVNRIMSGQTECPSFDAVAAIVKAMGGSLDELAGISHPHKHRSSEVDERVIAVYEKEIESLTVIHDKQIKDKNLWIKSLFVVVILLIAGFVSLFAYDLTHHDRGWYVTEQEYVHPSENS